MDKQEREEIKEIIKEETKHLATREEMKKGFDDVNARIDGLTTVMTEMQKSAAQTQTTLMEMQASFDRHGESLANYFRSMDKRFVTLETRVAKLEERVEAIENRLNMMSRQLENISDSVAELRAERKHDVTYILSLGEKVLAERTEAQNEYQSLATKLSELEARIAKLEGKSNG